MNLLVLPSDDLPSAKKSKLDTAFIKKLKRTNQSTETTQAKRKCTAE